MEELSKSIVCFEQIIDDKQTKVDGAKWRITIAEPVMERLAKGTLTTEEAVELLKAQKMRENAEKLIAVEQPLIEKLQKDLAELQLKRSKAGAGARGDTDGSTTSDRSVSSTINMIELRTKRELKDLELEFVEAKNKINDAIEDLEEELNEAISTTKKEENEKEIARLCKLLTRAERDYANKVDGIKNIAEIEKDRVIGERQQQMEQLADNESFKTTRGDGTPVADNKDKSVEDWLHHVVLPEVPHKSPEQERKRFNFDQQFSPPPRKLELPSSHANPNYATMDKDAMIIHLMQTQLGVMQRSQTSNADKKLPDFSGDPSDWGNFYAAYERTQEKYKFEDSDNIARLQTALKGPAKEAVKHLLCNVANLQKIMEVLKMQFGRPEFVLDFLMAKAKSSKKPDLSKPETIVAFGRAVEDLVTNIAAYNEDDYMQNKQLVVVLVEKMPGPMKDKWYTWLAKDDFRKTNLSNFSSWLSKQVKVAILQLKPTIVEEKSEEKPSPRHRRPPGTVNAAEGEEKEPRKACPVCSSKSHGIDNCWSLKKKTEDERWKLVREARVCFSCLKPGHMTKDCQEARKCGLDGCNRLHHRLLHTSSSKGATDTKSKSEDKDGNKSDGSIGVAMSIVKGFDGPLPIVPVRLVGRKGETIVTHALLDSGATRTLIKRSLADKLDLQGPSVNYRYKLINGEVVENNSAKKVAFKISGKYRNAPTFHLTDAITVERIGLSPYSLDVDAAKKEWSHLRRYKGPSLSKVVTEIVIGTDYGYLMMHKELLYSSIENPVGIRTVLGWAIQGKVKTTDIVGSSFCIGGISLDETLHQLDQQSFQLEDYGATESQAKSISIEDKRALKMLTENVADDGTRSDKISDLSSGSRWLQGPAFLMQEEDDWLKKEETGAVSMAAGDDENEADAVTAMPDVTAIKAVIPNIEGYSNYYRLIRATAAVSAAARYWLAKARKSSPNYVPWTKSDNGLESNISAGDFLQAERKLIIFVQHEYRGNKRINSSNFQTMKDEHGIVRMVGKIDNAKVGEEVHRPILLQAKNHLVDIIIDSEHSRNAHTGRNTVFNNLRQRFWIPDGRHAVRRSWTRCYHCRIKRAKPVMPEMGELPSFRLESHTPPFTYTGVDMFGPIEVTVGRNHETRWGMLFTCMVTRGIHLEVTSGLSFEETMMAMSRFADSRGLPKHMYSDNGTNFQALANYLQRRAKYMHLQWHFIPPAPPHMGGAWESMVKLVKMALYKILQSLSPRDQVLLTAFKAVEFIVNSRPLGFVSGDQDDSEMLTPNHFLRGVGVSSNNASSQAAESGSNDLPGEITEDSLKCGKQWEKAQAITKMFWDRWSKEVQPNLLRRNKWNAKKDSIRIGEIVLMVDDQKPRGKWSKGVATKTCPGKDGVVRVVEVTIRNLDFKTSHQFKRAVSKVCPLGLRLGDLDPDEE